MKWLIFILLISCSKEETNSEYDKLLDERNAMISDMIIYRIECMGKMLDEKDSEEYTLLSTQWSLYLQSRASYCNKKSKFRDDKLCKIMSDHTRSKTFFTKTFDSVLYRCVIEKLDKSLYMQRK